MKYLILFLTLLGAGLLKSQAYAQSSESITPYAEPVVMLPYFQIDAEPFPKRRPLIFIGCGSPSRVFVIPRSVVMKMNIILDGLPADQEYKVTSFHERILSHCSLMPLTHRTHEENGFRTRSQ